MGTNQSLAMAASILLGLLTAVDTAAAQTTTRISVDKFGVEGDLYSGSSYGQPPGISADNRYVAFESSADNLVAHDTNRSNDIFVKDRVTGAIVRVSLDSGGVQGNAGSVYPSLSADGRFIVFESTANTLVAGDTNGTDDIFLRDRDPDGNGIFEGNDVTTRVSVRSNGAQADGFSGGPCISADGSTIAYFSYATNLVAGDTNQCVDIFAYDRITATTRRVSVDSSGGQANHDSGSGCFTNGRIVAFSSLATNLVPGGTPRWWAVFTHDLSSGITEVVSVSSAGVDANGDSANVGASSDGQLVVFTSWATNLEAGDSNGVSDVFVHDRATGVTERVSVDSAGHQGDGESQFPSLSADGRFVAFESVASNLVAGDGNGWFDVFVHDRVTGTTQRVSVDSTGAEGNLGGTAAGISADGELVAFSSQADDLVANDTNGCSDVFVRERDVAIASNYGAGWPGTLGTPTILASADPVFGANITITISNSPGVDTAGLVLIGLAESDAVTGKGGTLLVSPLRFIPALIHAAGESFNGSIPNDPSLTGVTIDLQALEIDGGASNGMAFTNGLKLLLGF